MSLLLPKELAHARELIDQGKLDEAYEVVDNYEKIESLSPEDQLSALLIKGRIYIYKQSTRKALQIYEIAHQLSQDVASESEIIESLIGKSNIGFTGDFDQSFTYIKEAERRLSSLYDDFSRKKLKRDLLYVKSWVLLFSGNIFEAAKSATECLKLTKEEDFGNKLDLAAIYVSSGWINSWLGNTTKALDYAMKSLKYNTELNHPYGLADDYVLLARVHDIQGNYNKAVNYCKQALSIKELSKRSRISVLDTLTNVYWLKSEVNRAIKYKMQTITLSEELNLTDQIIINIFILGYYYIVIGNDSKAIEYLERSLTLSEKWGFDVMMAQSLGGLTMVYMRNQKSVDIANRYFSRLSNLYEQTKDKGDRNIYFSYLFSKATMMKYSARIRDRMEAQALYKELIDFERGGMPNFKEVLIFSIGSLCVLLLEELSMNNDPAILDEILPLINRSLNIAKKARNYVWLAETKLLQAKLALIQLKIDEAQKLMVEAQRIADLHGLNTLAWGISTEHDKLLDQTGTWDNVKKNEASIAERIQLASTSEVLDRFQGKSVMESPDTVDEQSTVLLILAEGGALVFSYPFTDEWIVDEDLFSSFLSAFTSFSTEFFSKGLDRVKFGEDMMLMESIDSFSFCYLFKGQTYLAKQKLAKFTEKLQQNKSLWQNLEKHYKTSQILDLKDNPPLESLITEIFMSKN